MSDDIYCVKIRTMYYALVFVLLMVNSIFSMTGVYFFFFFFFFFFSSLPSYNLTT